MYVRRWMWPSHTQHRRPPPAYLHNPVRFFRSPDRLLFKEPGVTDVAHHKTSLAAYGFPGASASLEFRHFSKAR